MFCLVMFIVSHFEMFKTFFFGKRGKVMESQQSVGPVVCYLWSWRPMRSLCPHLADFTLFKIQKTHLNYNVFLLFKYR